MKFKVEQVRDTVSTDIARINRELAQLPREAYDVFVESTPKRTGNARKKTRLQGDEIVAAYPYAQKLDEGYSKQAPKGMSDPTGKFIERRADKIMKG